VRNKGAVLALGLAELRETQFSDLADAFSAHLARRRIAWSTVEDYLRTAAHFARWLTKRAAQASRRSLRSFVSGHLPRCRCPGRLHRCRIDARAALGHFATVLRAAGRFDDELPARCPVDDEVERYVTYLRDVRGCAPATCGKRSKYVHQFLSGLGQGPVEVARITPSKIRDFVVARPRPCRAATSGAIAGMLRSYLRFLCLEGRCPAGLVEAVPRPAHWRLASLPVRLSEGEVKRFLASFDPRARRGRRDRAMALCMVVLGLRAAEVAALELGDVFWREGRLRVPPTKTRRGRELPLPESVGRALAAYVRRGRPIGGGTRLFLRLGVLEGQPLDSAGVRCSVRQAYARAGLPEHYTGTHRLRHTAATRLVTGGASVKEIADVLGHASIDSTAIYAKVDLPRLRAVALPWPGRVQ
jgi:site-specific recombinase XerD